MTKTKIALKQLTEQELSTVLAALRLWQHHIDDFRFRSTEPDWRSLEDIVTNGSRVKALSSLKISELCERLNVGKAHGDWKKSILLDLIRDLWDATENGTVYQQFFSLPPRAP